MDAKQKLSIGTVYLNGLLQGISFTTIPAAANFLTSSLGFGFSSANYGALFLPMIVAAILASFFGGALGKRLSIKTILLTGNILNALSMALFAISNLSIHDSTITFPLILVAMFFLGGGFGASLTALNPFVVHYFPTKPSPALTALHSCLGIGTAIGPLFFSFLLHVDLWWLDPTIICLCYLVFFGIGYMFLPRRVEFTSEVLKDATQTRNVNLIFYLFITLALLYGIVETTFGNWIVIFLHTEKGLTPTDANYALALFWASITIGRIITVFLSLITPPRYIYRTLPIITLVGLFILYNTDHDYTALVASIIAGLGCSAYLPLTISFGEQNLSTKAALVSGVLIAIYMLGYGVASAGTGFLIKLYELQLSTIYFWLSIPIILLVIIGYVGTALETQNIKE